MTEEFEFRFIFHVETRARMPMEEYLKVDSFGNALFRVAQHHQKEKLAAIIRNMVYNNEIYDNIKIVERRIEND